MGRQIQFFGRSVGLALVLIAGLAACSAPPGGSTSQIRAGVGSDTKLQRAPSGAVYRYAMQVAEIPVAIPIQMRARRLSGGRMLFAGTMGLPLPGGADADAVAATFREGLRREGLAVRNGKLIIPIETRTDAAFRATSSISLRDKRTFVPHDCWIVIGRCVFDEILSNGARIRFVSETTEEGGVWTSLRRTTGSNIPKDFRDLRISTVYSIDRYGVVIDAFTTYRGGPKGPASITLKRQ